MGVQARLNKSQAAIASVAEVDMIDDKRKGPLLLDSFILLAAANGRAQSYYAFEDDHLRECNVNSGL